MCIFNVFLFCLVSCVLLVVGCWLFVVCLSFVAVVVGCNALFVVCCLMVVDLDSRVCPFVVSSLIIVVVSCCDLFVFVFLLVVRCSLFVVVRCYVGARCLLRVVCW